MKHALKGFVLLLVAQAIVRLAVMVVAPVFDPSEGRYAAICANMAESGDFLVPRFIHNRVFQSFDGKPPLLFQLGGAFCTVLGRREIAVRLPSFLAALGLLGLLFLVLRRLRDAAAARVAVLVCATSVASTATAIAAGDWSRRVEEEKKESREVRALVVADTGCGIPAADLPHIYTRFWRADASRSLPGNGLGLALVKAIVTSYGGRLHCDSVPGQGSAFTVVLPTDG